jgi:anaerobic selenocysteine-containing dehydrogenase
VRIVDGRAVKVEGNLESPVNRGGVCARGQAGLALLYHPDRIRGPRRRVGARGENRWQEISWDGAIAQLASELGRLRVAGEPQSLVLVDGEQTGTTHALWARLLDVFGSPNHVGHGATGVGAMAEATRRMTRKSSLPGYDFAHSRCVLLVGTGPLESSPHFMHLARAMAGESRPRLFCVSPRLPATATLVDEWIPVSPSGSASLLLSLAHVLLRERLGDESVFAYGSGFAPWTDSDGKPQPGLRAQVMAGFAPDKTESLTGISAERLERLARELAASRPSVVVADEGLCDPATASAALVVNALLGGLDVPGGMLLDAGVPLADLGRVDVDGIARSGLRMARIDGRDSGQRDVEASRLLALPEALISGKPYSVKALLLSYSNPAFSKPGRKRWLEAIAKIPFVVSFSPLLDESSLFADLLLPDHTFFERWDLVAPGRASRVLSLRQPVVRPLANTMQTGDVILRLARALGEGIAGSFPWAEYRQVVMARLEKIDGGAASALEELESKGVCMALGAQSTPRLVDDRAVKLGEGQPRTLLFEVRGVVPSTLAPTVGDPVRFPFMLVPFRGPGYAEGGMRQMAWLRELPMGARNPWPERIELSLEDARRLGIENGETVLVESSEAQAELYAEVRPGIRPGVLGLALGAGPGPTCDGEPRASSLLASLVDVASGHWLACATRAQVRKLA